MGMGDIHHSTVERLADARGCMWKKFQVMEDNISSLASRDQDTGAANNMDAEDETVVQQLADGSYKLAQRHCPHYADEHSSEHWRTLEQMAARVSHALGYNWLPLHSRILELTVSGHVVDVMGNIVRQQVRTPPTKYPIVKGWPWVDPALSKPSLVLR